MKHTLFILMLFLTGISNAQTVTIGTQVWMTKNLDVSTFRNGDPIPEAKTDEEWKKAGENKQPAWCYYNYDPANGAKYGKLYNWYAVNDPRGLAPEGWHVPSINEWQILIDFLGGKFNAKPKLKNTSGWDSYTTGGSKTCPNCVNWNAEYRRKVPCHTCRDTRSVPAPKVTNSGNGNNTSGFSGLPGGAFYRGFGGIGTHAYWWSTSSYEKDRTNAWYIGCDIYASDVYDMISFKEDGRSVRCLKD